MGHSDDGISAAKVQKKTESSFGLSFFVAPIGFEPIQTEPESAVLPLHNRAIAKSAAKIQFFLYRALLYEIFFLADENHFVPDISTDHNCLIINVIHFVIEGVVKDDFFVVAGQFRHSGTDRRGYNLVIIVVWEVKSAIIIVVIHIVVHHHDGAPSVEEGVGYDSSKRRAANDVVTIEIAAVNTVVEVVGDAIVVNRSDVMRNTHMSVIVVVVRVYVRGVRSAVTMVSVVTIRMSSRLSSVTGLVATCISVSFVAGTRHRLRLRFAFCRVTSLD